MINLIRVLEDRSLLISSKTAGVTGENNAEILKFIFPEKISGKNISELTKVLKIYNSTMEEPRSIALTNDEVNITDSMTNDTSSTIWLELSADNFLWMSESYALIFVPYPTFVANPGGGETGPTGAIPTRLSQLYNDMGFITAALLPTKTSQLQNDSGYITSASIPEIPTDLSDFNNDIGYITSVDIPAPPTIPTKVSDLENDSGYITEGELINKTEKTLNILMLTNSMGEDSFGYMPFIINSLHPELKIDICLCKLSSASFLDHYDYITNNRLYTSYRYQTASSVEDSVFQPDTERTLKQMLELNDWDMVLLHNSSIEQGNWESYTEKIPSIDTTYFDYIVNYIRENTTNGTKIGINMFATMGRNRVDLATRGCLDAIPGWLNDGHFYKNYTSGEYSVEIIPEEGKYYYSRTDVGNIGVMYQYTNSEFINVDSSAVVEQMKTEGRNKYYAMVVDCMKKLLKTTTIDYILPIGTAIQNARQLNFEWSDSSMNGKDLVQDGVHLREGLPVLIASYLSAEYFINLKGLSGGIFGDKFALGTITQEWVDMHISPNSLSEKHGTVIGMCEENVKLAQQCVAMALKSPFEFTNIADNPNINLHFDTVLDAPNDGKKYVRKNGNWDEFSMNSKTIVEDYTATDVALIAEANTDYLYGTLTNCSLSFDDGANGNEINIVFKSGSNPTVLTVMGNNQIHKAITVSAHQICKIHASFYLNKWIVDYAEFNYNEELPEGFTALKYIESSGHQYIKTDITNVIGLEVELHAQQTNLYKDGTARSLVGAKGVTKYADIICYIYPPTESGNSSYWMNHTDRGSSGATSTNIEVDTNEHIFKSSCTGTSQVISIDGGEFTSSRYDTVVGTLPLAMFGRITSADGSTAGNFVDQKLFYAKFKNLTDNIDMFLKPALDTNGKPCLVDINSVNKTVYYNMGTGEFGYETLNGSIVNPD